MRDGSVGCRQVLPVATACVPQPTAPRRRISWLTAVGTSVAPRGSEGSAFSIRGAPSMDAIGYVALSRQLGLERQLATIANNIANANTTGFLAEEMTFEAVLQRANRRVGIAYVQDLSPRPDMSEGEIKITKSPFDLAIAGDGFFAVETDNGIRYTRAGHFRLDDQNRLVTYDGNPVLDVDDQPIVLPGEDPAALHVAVDGTLSIAGEIFGTLQRARFVEPERFMREGSMLFATAEVPEIAADSAVYQGALEASNVQPILEMTAMMQTTRAFEATQKLIETQHDLTRQAVERLLDMRS
ncbi:MAG: flagellar hook-basal body protein [Geminicoccaceae bacterium]|nr:MAG: flagellar hook-basal body protein [Geminicoccaceae bacterium]